MKMLKSTLVTGLCAILLFMAGTLYAADLQSAKEAGQIGEQLNGYIGLVDRNAPADVRALVDEVNAKRRDRYQSIARQQSTPLAEVERVGGAKAIEMTKPGHYIQDSSGRWVRK
jgi:uncharacterized protein YdbL (DUF1318 family)